jgi:hypothetical protein
MNEIRNIKKDKKRMGMKYLKKKQSKKRRDADGKG